MAISVSMRIMHKKHTAWRLGIFKFHKVWSCFLLHEASQIKGAGAGPESSTEASLEPAKSQIPSLMLFTTASCSKELQIPESITAQQQAACQSLLQYAMTIYVRSKAL